MLTNLRRSYGDKFFKWIHSNHLIYNACWEDPRLDREALKIGESDSLLVITSAGCNVLDYLLDRPKEIHAIDMNPRQNALLELKIAGIRSLDFDDFFQLFGRGCSLDFEDLYRRKLRPVLGDYARTYWDWCLDYFSGTGLRPSFYFRGTSGLFARMVHYYIDAVKARPAVAELFSARTIADQKEIYSKNLSEDFWNPFIRWAMSRSAVLALLGVPRAQRATIEKTYEGGIFGYVRDCIETVFTRLSLRDNYFWSLYFEGRYSPERCPNYLKRENFETLRGLVDRVETHTTTVTDFLREHPSSISRYVLLDHMDWLNEVAPEKLQAEWQAIFDRAAPRSRIIWRSGASEVDFVDSVDVNIRQTPQKVGGLLKYENKLSRRLHKRDRVHTYASFYIAEVVA